MKIRGLFAALSLAVVLGACTSDVTLPAPQGADSEAATDPIVHNPLYETGGTMGSGN